MVREGYWDRSDVEAALRPVGVRQDEIEYLLIAEDLDYQKRYLDAEVDRLVQLYRKGQIGSQELALGLSAIIVRPERVAQIVAMEEARRLPSPKAVTPVVESPLVKTLVTQAVSSWTAAYRKWEISADDLEAGLAIVTQDPALARELRRVEESRYRPAPPAPPPAPEDPVIAASRRAAIASWIDQYRKGQISADVLELGLSPLIQDAERVKQIRRLEELRAPSPPGILPEAGEDPEIAALRQEVVRGHVELFRKRVIELDELYAYLVADGLSEPMARATAITQAVKRLQVPPLDSPYFQRDLLQPAVDEAMETLSAQLERGEITREQFDAQLLGVGVDAKVVAYVGDVAELRRFMREHSCLC
jgi:hypothetical protein